MENQKKPLIYYWLIALAVMFVINWLVLPMFANNTVQEVSYNVFLDELEAKNIDQVQVNEDVIYYSLKEDTNEETQTQIAEKMGISQVQVSRMEKRILKEMRSRWLKG